MTLLALLAVLTPFLMLSLTIPDLTSDPTYKAEADKMAGFNTQRRAVERILNADREKLDELQTRTRPNDAKLEALALVEPGTDRPPDPEELRQAVAERERQIRVLDQALKLQGTRVEAARIRASEKICKEKEPDYKRLVARKLEADCAAALADWAIIDFGGALAVRGIARGSLYPLNTPPALSLGDPADTNAEINRRIREAVQYKFLSGKESFLKPFNF